MKHIFYIHSGITYVVALATIKYLKLPVEAVIIILSRNVKINNNYSVLRLNHREEAIALLPTYGNRSVFKTVITLAGLDFKVARAAGFNPFTLYLPSEKNYLMQFLQTHPLCKKRHFIEEGLLTYQVDFKKNYIQRTGTQSQVRHILRSPFHLFRTAVGKKKLPSSLRDFNVFVATKTAKEVLQNFRPVLVDVNSIIQASDTNYSNIHNLYIFDAVVEMDLSNADAFMKTLENFIATRVPKNALYVKFHPFQKEHGSYLKIFQKYKVHYHLLGPEVIPEVIIAQSKSLSIYGLASSVLFYGKELGHYTESFSPSLAKEDAKYKEYLVNSTPKFIIESLHLL